MDLEVPDTFTNRYLVQQLIAVPLSASEASIYVVAVVTRETKFQNTICFYSGKKRIGQFRISSMHPY